MCFCLDWHMTGSRPTPYVPGRVQLISINNNMAPLEESKLKVMLVFTGGDSTNDRPGLVPSIICRLSHSLRMLTLRQITENSQNDLEILINGLHADAATNITAGLQTGLRVLNDRSLSGGRVVDIMLMSDGEQNAGDDAAQIPVGNMPVLKAIADNSMGGTFSDVQNTDNLSKAFSDLTVTRHEDESTIEQVSAGSYPQSKDDDAGSVTVTFGDLYSKEVRKVIVDLLLPEISKERGADVLEIAYSYSTGGKTFEAPPATLTVRRNKTALNEEERLEVITEETCLQTTRMIKEARVMADDNKLDDARDKLVTAHNSLEDAIDESNPLLEMLRIEVQQLLKLTKSQEMYELQGRPFALSSETCHDRQRFASRGDVESLRPFATPRMDKYLEQAKLFDKDVKEELAANPLAAIAGAIVFYIQAAVQSLQAIEKIIKRGL
ncbi:protein binding protein, putative [Ricinus communis]|uniref:Protein binding protein, putative n=1 Tax=Ricinus communis TaxID=3988 RepID=B9S1C3_RICCO|nr:protein binding protein, putative [Ricinus communis]